MVDLSLHLLFYFTFIYIHTQGAAQIHEIVTEGESAQLKGGRFKKKKKVTKRVHKAGGEEVADSKRREKGSSDIIIGWQRKRTGVDELGGRS